MLWQHGYGPEHPWWDPARSLDDEDREFDLRVRLWEMEAAQFRAHLGRRAARAIVQDVPPALRRVMLKVANRVARQQVARDAAWTTSHVGTAGRMLYEFHDYRDVAIRGMLAALPDYDPSQPPENFFSRVARNAISHALETRDAAPLGLTELPGDRIPRRPVGARRERTHSPGRKLRREDELAMLEAAKRDGRVHRIDKGAFVLEPPPPTPSPRESMPWLPPRGVYVTDLEALERPAYDWLHAMQHVDDLVDLAGLLARLSPRQQAVMMGVLHGYRLEEIRKALGISLETATRDKAVGLQLARQLGLESFFPRRPARADARRANRRYTSARKNPVRDLSGRGGRGEEAERITPQ